MPSSTAAAPGLLFLYDNFDKKPERFWQRAGCIETLKLGRLEALDLRELRIRAKGP